LESSLLRKLGYGEAGQLVVESLGSHFAQIAWNNGGRAGIRALQSARAGHGAGCWAN
jgi:hypothetical protein